VVDRQSNAPAAFTPGEIRGTHFQRLPFWEYYLQITNTITLDIYLTVHN